VSGNAADRIVLAVDVLDPQPGERILEIGSGHGVAAGRVAERIGEGLVVGVDRSAKMTAAALRRNAVHVAAGRARFITADIESWDPGEGQIDAALAINVIAFADMEHRGTAVVHRALRPGGRICLVFQPPEVAQLSVASRFGAALEAHGFGIDRCEVLDRPSGQYTVVTGLSVSWAGP